MSLLSSNSNASARQMFRFLTALLISVLLSSHGTMGVAAPHADGSVHMSAHMHVAHDSDAADIQAVDDNHEADVSSETETSSEDDGADSPVEPSAAHAHAAADQIPALGMMLPDFPFGDTHHAGLVVPRLPSAPQSPLLEPPSA